MREPNLRKAARELRFQHLSRLRGTESGDFAQRVAGYYEQITPLLLETFGHSYQVAIWKAEPKRSNLIFGRRAGLRDGSRVLDMGCGCGGPALDWLKAYPALSVEGVTVASRQVEICRELAKTEGLEKRWRISQGDFHHLPHSDESFDLCLFLESSGHTEDLVALFREVFRVLRPGGRVYCKEPFLQNQVRREELAESLADFEEIYTHRLLTLEEATRSLVTAGFEGVEARDISEFVDTRSFWERMRDSEGKLTEFGCQHSFGHPPLPILIGELLGVKPSDDGSTGRGCDV